MTEESRSVFSWAAVVVLLLVVAAVVVHDYRLQYKAERLEEKVLSLKQLVAQKELEKVAAEAELSDKIRKLDAVQRAHDVKVVEVGDKAYNELGCMPDDSVADAWLDYIERVRERNAERRKRSAVRGDQSDGK